MSNHAALIDIGANLTHQSFADDLDAVLQRAAQHSVDNIIVTGTSVTGSQQALALAKAYPERLYATAGIHPHEAKTFRDTDIDALRALAANGRCCAIGEAGLDYHRNFSPPEAQLAAFEAQLELAADLGMPVFVHERDAGDDMLQLLAKFKTRLDRVVVHCFTGAETTLRAYLEMDLHIGITGWICDERRGTHLRELVKLIPAGRLMLETDAPYLMPRDYPDLSALQSSRRNEPCTLMHIATTVAACRNESLNELTEHCRQTSQRFFGLESVA